MYRFGITTDIQYAEKPVAMGRFYSESLLKLEEAADIFLGKKVDAWIDLGDVIDENEKYFDDVLPYFRRFPRKKFHLLGNHDYLIHENLRPVLPDRFALPRQVYYFTDQFGPRMIFLNGNDISLHASVADTPERREAEEMLKALQHKGFNSANWWNAAIGKEQLLWLEDRLKESKQANQDVLIFCHFPVLPNDSHSLWNGEEVCQLLWKYDNVKAWINGHQHDGDYDFANGIHFLTLRGMVQGTDNAFAVLELGNNVLHVRGYGRQEDYELTW